MKTPADFRGTTGILNRSMVLIVTLYIGLGLAGYIRYGTGVHPTITVNLPEKELYVWPDGIDFFFIIWNIY